jgi:hypothetical protein
MGKSGLYKAWYTTSSKIFRDEYPQSVELDIEYINTRIDNNVNFSIGKLSEPINNNEKSKIIGYVFNTMYEKFREHALNVAGLSLFTTNDNGTHFSHNSLV